MEIANTNQMQQLHIITMRHMMQFFSLKVSDIKCVYHFWSLCFICHLSSNHRNHLFNKIQKNSIVTCTSWQLAFTLDRASHCHST